MEDLDDDETEFVDQIFDDLENNNPPSPTWTKELEQVQPWIQQVYESLAQIYNLTVVHDTRTAGDLGEKYADHYLTYPELSHLCSTECSTVDFTNNWAFESKGNWQVSSVKKAIVQCYHYTKKFFEDNTNHQHKYVSIVTDARRYRFWYAFYNIPQRSVNAGMTADYDWSPNTLYILARVFKTFSMIRLPRAGASPQDFGNLGPSEDISNNGFTPTPDHSIATIENTIDVLMDQGARNKVFYELILEGSRNSPSGLPIIPTSIGDIKAIRLLGTGSDSVIFEACTTNNERAAIKYSLGSSSLQREAEMLKKLKEVKDIPRLLHEALDRTPSYIITSMVGQKVFNINAQVACNIIIDILGVLKSLHGHGYIHNDIHPSNVVDVDGRYRLIDFGRAVPLFHKRDTAPSDWPKGHIVFASHNWGKYLGAGDDLEALSYTVAFMHDKSKEYWRIAHEDLLSALQKKEEKLLYLFDGLPQAFRDFYCYAYDLDIDAIPDYGHWQKLFKDVTNDLALPKRCLSTPPGSPERKQLRL